LLVLISLPVGARQGSSAAPSGRAAARVVARHPLDPLTAEEINLLRGILLQEGGFTSNTLFVWAQLREPPKDEVLAFAPGRPFRREAQVVAISPEKKTSYEIRVNLRSRRIEAIKPLDNLQPFLANPEFDQAARIVNNSAAVRAALEKRGYQIKGNVSDRFYLDTYAPGRDDLLVKNDKTIRAIRVLFSDRQGGTNSYGPYVEGLMALVDVFGQRIIALQDLPGAAARQIAPSDIFDRKVLGQKLPDAKLQVGPPVLQRLKLDGHHVRWESWDFRFSFNQREGLVLHQIAIRDQGRLRSVCYRAAVSEMLVPYADPSPAWIWREFFDAGEYGLGYVSSEANAGKDLPGNALTLDAVLPDESLHVSRRYPNRVFFYERDGGALFAHTQAEDGSRIYARARELVVGFVATVGNYDYVYKWVFRQDGSFSFEMELQGLILNKTVNDLTCRTCAAQAATGPGVYEAGDDQQFGTLVSPQIEGVFHQHWVNLRMDFDIDGPTNAVEECDTVALPRDAAANPRGRAFTLRRTVFGREQEAERNCNAASNRVWVVYNPGVQSGLGHFSGYEIEPEGNTISAIPEFRFGQDASFTQRHFWATKYHPDELYAAGKYPNQAPENSRDNLFHYAADNENIYAEDIVLWYSLGFTHVTRPEDYPIMPAARIAVNFAPRGFFTHSPALGYATTETPKPK